MPMGDAPNTTNVTNVTSNLTQQLAECLSDLAPHTAVGGHHEAVHHSNQADVVFAIFFCLFIGAGLHYMFKGTPLPYTVVLLIFGCIMGIIGTYNKFIDRFESIADIDPHLLLHVFLPVLIFESAFNLDYHVFMKSLPSIITIAVFGVGICTGLIGCLLRCFPYNLSWTMCMLLGCILSATDPVAVVALLRDLGASKTLATLIEGESLLNDGVAIVIFVVLKASVVEGVEITPQNALGQLCYVGMGGPVVGFVFGWFFNLLLGRVVNNDTVELILTLTAPYMTFYLAEVLFEVSGVLAVVVLGVYMSNMGLTLINSELHHFLEHFYELMAFIANTLIFILCGVVIGRKSLFNVTDVGWLMLLYVGMTFIRAGAILLLSPVLKRVGYGLTPREGLVLVWGGLRGSLGLALALVLKLEMAGDDGLGDLSLFFIGGIVVLTLVVNGTTTGPLLRVLGMTAMSVQRALMIRRSILHLRDETEKQLAKLQLDPFLSNANWQYVRSTIYTPMIPKKIIKVLEKAAEEKRAEAIAQRRRSTVGPVTDAPRQRRTSITDRVKQTVTRYTTRAPSNSQIEKEKVIFAAYKSWLTEEKKSYWNQFTKGVMSRDAYLKMNAIIDRKLDDCTKLVSFEDIVSSCKIPGYLQTAHDKLHNVCLLGNMTRSQLYARLLVTFDIAFSYLRAQKEVMQVIDTENAITSKHWQTVKRNVFQHYNWKILAKGIDQHVWTKPDSSKKRVSMVADKDVARVLLSESNEIQDEVKKYIGVLSDAYPDICIAIKSNLASQDILKVEKDCVMSMGMEGTLELEYGNILAKGVRKQVFHLNRKATLDRPLNNIELLSQIPWICGDGPEKRLLPHGFEKGIREITFHEGDWIFKKGSVGKGIYLINRGLAKIYRNGVVVSHYGPGTVMGEWEFLAGEEHDSFEAKAETYMYAIHFDRKYLDRLLNENLGMKEDLWEASLRAQSILLTKLQELADGFELDEHHEQIWAAKGSMKLLKEGEVEFISNDKMVLYCHGHCETIRDNNHLEVQLVSELPTCLESKIKHIGTLGHIGHVDKGHAELICGPVKLTCVVPETRIMIHEGNYTEGLMYMNLKGGRRRWQQWKRNSTTGEEGIHTVAQISSMMKQRRTLGQTRIGKAFFSFTKSTSKQKKIQELKLGAALADSNGPITSSVSMKTASRRVVPLNHDNSPPRKDTDVEIEAKSISILKGTARSSVSKDDLATPREIAFATRSIAGREDGEEIGLLEVDEKSSMKVGER